MHTQIDSDVVRNFQVPSRTRWLYMYFVLAALGLAAISTSLSFSQAITDDFSDAVATNYEWVEREGLYSELIRLANACEEPIVSALETGHTKHVSEQLRESVKSFRHHLQIAREETNINIDSRDRVALIAELDRVSESLRGVELEGRQVLEAKDRHDDDQAIAHFVALNRNSQEAAQTLADAFKTIRESQGKRFEQQLREAETLRGYQAWSAIGVLGLIVCVSLYGHRLSTATHESMRTMTTQAQSLADQEARLRTIFATAAEGIVTIHADGVIESCNKATLDLFRCEELEIVGHTLRSIMTHNNDVSDGNRPDIVPSSAVSLDSLVGQRQELIAARPDGTSFIVDFAAAEIRCNDHRVITGILHDVTDRKLFEAKLEQARHAAESATRAKSQFLANMSHEIRTPMTAILGFADLLREPGQSDEERTRCAETIRRNADHLLSLLNDILDLSKIEAGRMSVEQIKCRPCGLVQDVATLTRQRAKEKGIDFDVIFDTPIPETISGDPVRIRQILLNLVGNSIKFTDEGHVQLHVWMQDVETEPSLHFKIVDTGIGMSEEQTARLFRPFTQADSTTTRQFGGTGLGLSICKRLVEMMGGNIKVTSVVGLGSTFSFYLPTGDLDDCSWVESYSQPVTTAPTNIETNAGRLAARVLLAEDGVDNRRLISYHLQKAGATVVHTENGKDAVQQALLAAQLNQPFDIILMDMQMPIMDGYQATGELRQHGYRRPIVALTAHAMSGDREKCINAGCDDYLTKPIVPHDLLDTVRRFSALNQDSASPSDEDQTTSKASTDQVAVDGNDPTRALGGDDPDQVGENAIGEVVSPPSSITPSSITPSSASAGADQCLESQSLVGGRTVDGFEEPLVSEYANDPEILEILEIFIESLNGRIESIDTLFIDEDWLELADVAHQMKGAAGGYGFPTITEVAAEVERLSSAMETSDTQAKSDVLTQLKSCVDRLVFMCRRAMQGVGSTHDEASNGELVEPTESLATTIADQVDSRIEADITLRESTLEDEKITTILAEIEGITATDDNSRPLTDKLREIATVLRASDSEC
jgi:PAS domain S-box-containing protein